MNEHWVFICIDQKREESKSLERQRKSNVTFSISTKFRKIVQENRVGVSQDVLLWLTASHDENARWKFYKIRHCKADNLWSRSGLKHMIWRSHHANVLFSYHNMEVLYFSWKTFGLTTSRIFHIVWQGWEPNISRQEWSWQLFVLLTNVRLGWKCLAVTNTPAYYNMI